jgi:hypothetical protein
MTMPEAMLIEFPEGDTYANNLGRLRKKLKTCIRNLPVKKRRKGALCGSPKQMTLALLIMPEGYTPRLKP